MFRSSDQRRQSATSLNVSASDFVVKWRNHVERPTPASEVISVTVTLSMSLSFMSLRSASAIHSFRKSVVFVPLAIFSSLKKILFGLKVSFCPQYVVLTNFDVIMILGYH